MKLWRSSLAKLRGLPRIQKFMLLGIGGVMLLYLGAAGIYSYTVPWGYTDGDQIAHLDYIWRIYKGDLPKYDEGVTYKPFIDIKGGNIYQRAVGHPPLFHAVQAPVVGYLMDRGAWQTAIAVGRAINLFQSLILIGILAWAGWLFGGRRKEIFAVAVPALSVTAYRFLRLNKDYAMEGFVTILTTLTIINLYYIFRYGLKKKYLIWLIILSLAGMFTKISYLPFLAINLAAVAWVVAAQKGRKLNLMGVLKGSVVAGVIGLLTALGAGWYYYFWNFKQNGNFVSPLPPTFTGDRAYRPLSAVIFSDQFWSLFYGKYIVVEGLSLVVTTLALAGLLQIGPAPWIRKIKDRVFSLALLAMLGVTVGTIAIQFRAAYPYGAINFRYLLPAILPISLLIGYGLLSYRHLRGQLVALVAILSAGTTVLSIRLKPGVAMLLGVNKWPITVRKIYQLGYNNHIPFWMMSSLFLAFWLGAGLLSFALWRMSKPATEAI